MLTVHVSELVCNSIPFDRSIITSIIHRVERNVDRRRSLSLELPTRERCDASIELHVARKRCSRGNVRAEIEEEKYEEEGERWSRLISTFVLTDSSRAISGTLRGTAYAARDGSPGMQPIILTLYHLST